MRQVILFLNQFARSLGIKTFAFFGQLIAVFFIIAGFLFAGSIENSEEPESYLKRYIVKYAVLYYLVAFVQLFIHYYELWRSSGVFMYKDFIYVLIVMPVLNIGAPDQLWFIPPLLVGIGISGYVKIHNMDRYYKPILLFLTLFTVIASFWSGYVCRFFPSLYSSEKLLNFWNFLACNIEGMFCVWCGMTIFNNKIFMHMRLKKALLLCIILSVVEIWFYYKAPNIVPVKKMLPASLFLWSVILMRPILSINMFCLKKWHREITVFSGLMYFLHIGEAQLLGRLINNSILNFLIYTTFNVFLTFFICQVIMTRKGTDK